MRRRCLASPEQDTKGVFEQDLVKERCAVSYIVPSFLMRDYGSVLLILGPNHKEMEDEIFKFV